MKDPCEVLGAHKLIRPKRYGRHTFAWPRSCIRTSIAEASLWRSALKKLAHPGFRGDEAMLGGCATRGCVEMTRLETLSRIAID